jgi:NhaP-type Na+/H+ or K+/H+ antiporter
LTIVSLVSYIVKERAYISQAVLALGVGIALGPIGLDWISPARWCICGCRAMDCDGTDAAHRTNHNPEIQDKLTFEITRVVLGIQVLFTGIGLPQRYLAHAWRSLSVVLLPLMIAMWLVSSLIVFLVVPDLTFAESLCIGACVTPTDPVLAASVIKGRFAEKHVPKNVVDLLAAESGANDGLGVAFMGLALFLCKRQEEGWSLTKVAEKWVLESVRQR